MQQHAVPRQITTFEFKLIGFLTLRQFGYLAFTAGVATIVYFIIPVPIVNIVLTALVIAGGVALAFLKPNERPLDIWIRNFITSLLTAQAYYFHKNNTVPDFLKDVYITPAHIVATHIDATKKLSKYIGVPETTEDMKKKQEIMALLHATPLPIEILPQQLQQAQQVQSAQVQTNPEQKPNDQQVATSQTQLSQQPFLSGIIKNNKDEPLPSIMMYINNATNQTVRILKTNHHGVFATFHSLPNGVYTITPKDLGAKYFFDTMNITVDGSPIQPINIYSKELL